MEAIVTTPGTGEWVTLPNYPAGGPPFSIYQLASVEAINTVVVLGDANGDGNFDFGDIEAFFLAVTDLPAYTAQYPDVAILLLDMNDDGNTDFGDIEAFFTALTED